MTNRIKKFAYTFLNAITFGKGLTKKVNGLRVKLPVRYIQYFPSDYESDNFRFLKSSVQQGSVVLDLGAHIGLFSTIAGKLVGSNGKVFAIEPAPSTWNVLTNTISINDFENIVVPVNQAMGKEVGTITFYVSENEVDNSNSLVSYKKDRKINGIEVSVNTIDNFVNENKLLKVDFIKIDVEGAEYDALRGGVNVFRTLRPNFILAIHPLPILEKGDRLEDIYDLLVSLNYKIACNNSSISREAFCANTELIDLHLTSL